jgi:hypothetical protein
MLKTFYEYQKYSDNSIGDKGTIVLAQALKALINLNSLTINLG